MTDGTEKVSYAVNAMLTAYGLTVGDIVGIVAAICGVSTAVASWHFKRKHFNLELRKFEEGKRRETANN